MWIVIDNEMWNTDNLEGIVAEDNQVIFVFKNHNERYSCTHKASTDDVLVSIEVALKSGQKIWNGLPDYLDSRSEELIYHRFG